MKKTLEESKQRILEIMSQTNDDEAIKRLKSKEVVYMELKESKFMCGQCIFFKDGFCNSSKVKSIVNGSKGCCNLYSPKDKDIVGSFSSKMSELLTGKIDYRRLSENARKTIVARFSLEGMGEKYREIFDELIQS